jgi:hypothetical protein
LSLTGNWPAPSGHGFARMESGGKDTLTAQEAAKRLDSGHGLLAREALNTTTQMKQPSRTNQARP